MTLTFSHNVDVNFAFVEIVAKKFNQPKLEDDNFQITTQKMLSFYLKFFCKNQTFFILNFL